MKIDGGCHCGRITYEAEVDPEKAAICHCTDCQALSASAFRTYVPAAKEGFRLSGTPKLYVKIGESGNRRVQAFCPECGSALYAAAENDPQVFNIRLGTARQRAQLQPRRQIWTRSAQPWLGRLAAIPATEKQQ